MYCSSAHFPPTGYAAYVHGHHNKDAVFSSILPSQSVCHAVQMYPQSSESQSDVLAANEVATHVTLQQRQDSPFMYHLLGGFEVQDPNSSPPGREQVSCHHNPSTVPKSGCFVFFLFFCISFFIFILHLWELLGSLSW